MRSISKTIRAWLLFSCFAVLATPKGAAQSLDIRLLEQFNPTSPESPVWRGFSNTAYPVAVLANGAVLADDYFRPGASHKDVLRKVGEKLVVITVTEGFKLAVNRTRPYVTYPQLVHPYDASEQGLSFPSAHTSIAFSTAATLSLHFNKWYITVPAYAWATCVGYSRLYLGEHYPSDVLAGAVIGIGSVYLTRWLDRRLWPAKKRVSETRAGLQ